MVSFLRGGLLILVWQGAMAAQVEEPVNPQPQGPLADYVAKPDDSFRWVKRREGKLGAGEYVELTLTSQTWQKIVWKHQLFIYKPGELKLPSQAILLIDGGRWRDELEQPAGDDEQLPRSAFAVVAAADQLKSPVAVLRQVPQQPLFDGMVEDQIISFTFARYVLTGNSEWLLLLPMVKSAVRGMDAVQQFARDEWSIDIEHFTVTGASKRGWTTWLTAAIDPRVNALAPMVIDMLNWVPHMKLQQESFGGYSEQLEDYTSKGLHHQLGTPFGQAIQKIVDPYSYRTQITQPKLILLGTNDRYWPLDALNLYWNDLPGEKYVLYVPNNEHGLRDYPRIVGTINALHRHVAEGKPLPKLNWKFHNGDGKLTLRVESDLPPREVQAWVATADTRDFRESQWKSHPMTLNNGAYTYELPLPNAGHSAVFGEAIFDGDPSPYYLSTNVQIVGP